MSKIRHPPSICAFNRVRISLNPLFVAIMCVFSFSIGSFLSHKPFYKLNIDTSNFKLPILTTNTTADLILPALCVVSRIYGAQLSYFPVLALALYHSGPHNIRIYVINTDNRTEIQQLKQVVQLVNQLVLRKDFVIFLDLGKPSSNEDFGYGMTDRALAYLYEQHTNSSSICQYVIFTNADNFYSRSFTAKILPHMKAGKDIIAWDFISRYIVRFQEIKDPMNRTVPEIVDDGTEKYMKTTFRKGQIDLGAAAYKLSFLKKDKLYFVRPGRTELFTLDGDFAEDAIARTNASVILRQTLFMHQ